MKSKMNLCLLDVPKSNAGDYDKRKSVGTELLSSTGNGMVRSAVRTESISHFVLGSSGSPNLALPRSSGLLDDPGRRSRRSPLSTSRTTCTDSEVCTTAWRKHPPHVARNLCARACQLSLYCSVRHTQHLRCLEDRETVDDA